jgi:amino acid adenylation domain-containing protein
MNEPATAPSSTQFEPRSVIDHAFSKHHSKAVGNVLSTLVLAAWGLVVNLQLNADEDILLDVAVQGLSSADSRDGDPMAVIPLSIAAKGDKTIAEYLKSIPQLEDGPTEEWDETTPEEFTSHPSKTLLLIHSTENHSNQHGLAQVQKLSEGYLFTVAIHLSIDGIIGRAEFSPQLFQPTLARALLERLDLVMSQLETASPDSKLTALNMVTPRDLDTIWKWNHQIPEQIDRCVHDIFQSVASSQPDAQAVCSWDGDFTYGELDRLSTILAWKLSSLGVGTDMVVPLCFHKSRWTIVALLGVLKAGGAFLLLDPSLPEKRLQYMTQIIKPRLILASRSTHDLSSYLVDKVVIVESETFAEHDHLSSWELPVHSPSSLMYVIFTSGSTGIPKCALISHTNVASAFHHQAEVLRFTRHSRILDFSSYSFTTTISNVFGALLLGGCLCVPSEDDRKNKLAEVIRSLQVDIVDLTPSVMQFLDPEEVPDLKVIIFGGEAISPREIGRWWGRVHTIQLYGQSECTSNAVINGNPVSQEDVLRIGHGSGLLTWIVDPEDHHKLQPVGCVGELLLEGPLVGCGYMNQPDESAASFIEDPSWLLDGLGGSSTACKYPGRRGRLYKTGDLVQYNEDGSLTFLGRKDSQVKIRGQRVELGEVEHWVKKCTGSKMAVAEVITPRGKNPSPTLVAFLEDKDAEDVQAIATRVPADLEAKLVQHLPVYMIPTTLFTMRAIPTTATGKVNRKELRQLGASLSTEQLAQLRTSTGSKRQPVTLLEKTVHAIWSQVLGIEPIHVGLDDSFFHLGGDSVAAIKVVAEARKAGVKLAVADIFSHPILHDLVETSASELDHVQTDIAPFELLNDHVDVNSFLQDISARHGIDPSRVQDAFPCTSLQEGLFSLSLTRPGACVEQSLLELAPQLTEEDLRAAWSKVINATPVLRTRFIHHNTTGIVQIVLDDEMSWDSSSLDLEAYLEVDRKKSVAFGEPLTRFGFVHEPQGTRKWLVWTAHHALYDGWSIRLIKDALYKALRGVPIEPAPQFQSFIKHVRQQDHEKTVEYWRKTFDSCQTASFPTLPPTIQQPVADQVVYHNFPLPLRLDKSITTTSLIHASWALVIGHASASDEVVFGVTTSGRTAPVERVEAIVAPTFATIPLRVNIAAGQKVSEYLKTTQQQSVNVVPFEQAGIQHIAKMSPGCENACMFQSLLVIQRQSSTESDHSDTIGTWKTISQHRWLNTYALMLEIRLGDNDIHISASFDQRVVHPDFVCGLLHRLEYAMLQLDSTHKSSLALSQVGTATPTDLNRIWGWNSHLPAPEERCIHEIIQERVISQPQAPAICAWDGELTYQELDGLSGRIGHYLTTLGVQPDTLIPLCFEKSMWTAVAMLSVLKAGAGFALLEPNLPEDRLHTIVSQLDTELILSSAANASLSSRLSKTVIQIGPELAASLSLSPVQELTSYLPSNAMFAVFTSGTTGKPKCVVLSHTSFCSGLKYQSELLGFSNKSRVFDFAAYSFDIAVHNVFATLASGGCLCVPAEKDRWGNTAKAMADMRVTLADLTPSVARLIDPLTVPSLETLVMAGEAVSLGDVSRWQNHARVINAYGPAECQISTVNATPSTLEEATRIGKGAGLLTWVVHQHDHNILLPPGYTGELLLEGPLLSRGYLGDPQETSAKFVHDLIWLLEGNNGNGGRRGRMYKTGDLVRYHEDGSLSFMGRKDTQVKLRGQRVELGEVEHYVKGCMPNVPTVVAEVILPRGESSSPMLVVFLEASEGMVMNAKVSDFAAKMIPIPSDVDAKLSKYLPRHMRPSAFISMLEIPMTSTGKTDRKRLQKIGATFSVQDLVEKQTLGNEKKTQPTSDTEWKMQKIWADVLGIAAETIGLDDNFFQLGGDSIAVLKVVERAREVGIELAVLDIFHHPSLSIRPGRS